SRRVLLDSRMPRTCRCGAPWQTPARHRRAGVRAPNPRPPGAAASVSHPPRPRPSGFLALVREPLGGPRPPCVGARGGAPRQPGDPGQLCSGLPALKQPGSCWRNRGEVPGPSVRLAEQGGWTGRASVACQAEERLRRIATRIAALAAALVVSFSLTAAGPLNT